MMTALMLVCLAAAGSQDKDPDKIILSLDMVNSPAKDVLSMIEKASGLPIELDDAAKKSIDLERAVTFKVKDLSVSNVLALFASQFSCQARWVDKKKFVLSPSAK